MIYHQASARFLLDRIPLSWWRTRTMRMTNGERSDERDDELAAEQAAGDAAVNEMVGPLADPDLGPQATPTPGAGPRSWDLGALSPHLAP